MLPCPGFLHGWWLWSMLHPPWVKCPWPTGADVHVTSWLEANRSDERVSAWKNVSGLKYTVKKRFKSQVKKEAVVTKYDKKTSFDNKHENYQQFQWISRQDDSKTRCGWQTALLSHPVGLKQCMHCSSYLTDNMKNKERSQEWRSRQRAERKGRM